MSNNNGLPFKVQSLWSAVSSVVEAVTEEVQTMSKPPPSAHEKPPRQSPVKQNEPEPELVTETKIKAHIVEVPKGIITDRSHAEEHDWEILSERISTSSFGADILVARAGSVRSITSIDHDNSSNSHTTLSLPFKIQRTASSSTIDSQDNVLGPSGKGVLGVDYVEHVILPTDTLQGVCLSYKVSAGSLRRANHFTGTSLHSAPKKLLIPLSKQALRTGFIRVQDTDTKEFKLHYFQAEHPNIAATEAKAYLELADWVLKDALRSAREDREWEEEECPKEGLRSGQIGLKAKILGGKTFFNLKGAGRSSSIDEEEQASSSTVKPESPKPPPKKEKVVVHTMPPPYATKSVFAEDLYNAAPEQGGFGLELKPVTRRENNVQ